MTIISKYDLNIDILYNLQCYRTHIVKVTCIRTVDSNQIYLILELMYDHTLQYINIYLLTMNYLVICHKQNGQHKKCNC